MVLSDLSIKRPVLATVMNLVIILVGFVAYEKLSMREYPNIDVPVVTVTTIWRGANAEIIETQVTKPIEDALSGIEGVDFIRSISRSEQSQITVTFVLDRKADAATSDVRDRVSRVRGELPQEIDEPVISKVEADATPIIYLAFSSDRHTPLEVSDVADRLVKDRLGVLPGVSDVTIFGERRYAMRIWLDRGLLASRGLTVQDVENALRSQNVEIPAGRVESFDREFTVLAQTDLRDPKQFEKIVLKETRGFLVRMGDVARVELGAADTRMMTRYNRQPAVALGVIKQSVANPLDVSKAVKAELPRIKELLPEGMRVDVGYDATVFIDASISNVFHAIGEATVLVVLVIFLFLRAVRATVVPLVTIPVCLIGSFAVMMALGFSINTLTLLSLVLAIGLVVDDAIVMLENIYRHIENGMPPIQAAFKGSREIAFAIIAMTLTLAAVYAPVAFTGGRTGKLFTEFALTLAGAVIVSGFVALTLSPMMCSRLLKHTTKHGRLYEASENAFRRLTAAYQRVLLATLKMRMAVIGVMLAVAGIAVVAFHFLKSELYPIEDRSMVLTFVTAPEGSTITYLDKYLSQVEEIMEKVPEKDRMFAVGGFPVVNQGLVFMRINPWEKRDRSQFDVVNSLMPTYMAIPGAFAFPINPPSLGQSARTQSVEVAIQTTGGYGELQRAVDEVVAKARQNPGLLNVDSDLRLNKPQLTLSLDRDKAADLGVDVEEVGRTLETMFGGRKVTRFKREATQYDVIVQVEDAMRRVPHDLTSVFVKTRSGQLIALSNIMRVEETVAPRELNHFNKLRAATVTASTAPGYSLGEGLVFMRDAVRQADPKALVDYGGVSREFQQSSAALYATFLLALLFIYLVLSAQFESFIDPFIIMLSVPLAICGALLALLLSGGTLNIYSQIGLITLVGLITKHGILIVEFSNQLREQGKEMMEAVVEASVLRLRPILMTTGAMVLGAVPLAIASGAGAESRHQIGWVIVGGMCLGTLLTLFVVPTVYTFLARRKFVQVTDEAERPEPLRKAAE
jgi:multidrug efflux pump